MEIGQTQEGLRAQRRNEEGSSGSTGVATGTGPPELRPEAAVAAVVVMVCNRPQFLQRTIKSILE